MATNKAGATLHERKERERERQRADMNDKPAGLAICRAIRDDVTASAADRLKAIELIQTMKAEQ